MGRVRLDDDSQRGIYSRAISALDAAIKREKRLAILMELMRRKITVETPSGKVSARTKLFPENASTEERERLIAEQFNMKSPEELATVQYFISKVNDSPVDWLELQDGFLCLRKGPNHTQIAIMKKLNAEYEQCQREYEKTYNFQPKKKKTKS